MNIYYLLDLILFKDEVKDWLDIYDLPISGNKTDLIERLVNSSDFDLEDLPSVVYKESLQSIADLLELPRSGTKPEIWSRISDVLDQSIGMMNRLKF